MNGSTGDSKQALEKKPRSRSARRGPAPPGGTSPARRQAAVILEVLAGVRRPSEAAEALGASLPRYYQLERRALCGLVSACEPAPRGPRVDAAKRLAALERENRRLERECDRRQALVRMAERSLGLPPAPARPTGKSSGKSPPGSTGGRRRKRRPSVRALHVARGLLQDDAAAGGGVESSAVDEG